MEQLVRVRQVRPDGTAQVERVRESACSGDCHKCAGCGAAKQTVLLDAQNPIGAKAGQMVILRSESGPVLKAAVVLYMVPLVLFFLGYALGYGIWGHGALCACLGFVLGIALAVGYDRWCAGKRKTVYTITGYPTMQRWASDTEGDHDLD